MGGARPSVEQHAPRMLKATSFRRDCFPTGAVAPLGSSSWMASARSRGDTPYRRRLTAVALSGKLDRVGRCRVLAERRHRRGLKGTRPGVGKKGGSAGGGGPR